MQEHNVQSIPVTLDVLLVETDTEVITRTNKALHADSYTTTVVASAKEAFAILPALQPWLIVFDENLLDMTGHIFVENLHLIYAETERPLTIMLFNGGDRAFSEKYMPDMYIVRFFHPAELSMPLRRLRQIYDLRR